MTDREKVIEALDEIAEYFRECRSNVSFGSKEEKHFWELQCAALDARELLDDQAPVPPRIQKAVTEIGDEGYVELSIANCGNCGALIEQPIENEGWNYCPNCGKRVKWDAAD